MWRVIERLKGKRLYAADDFETVFLEIEGDKVVGHGSPLWAREGIRVRKITGIPRAITIEKPYCADAHLEWRGGRSEIIAVDLHLWFDWKEALNKGFDWQELYDKVVKESYGDLREYLGFWLRRACFQHKGVQSLFVKYENGDISEVGFIPLLAEEIVKMNLQSPITSLQLRWLGVDNLAVSASISFSY